MIGSQAILGSFDDTVLPGEAIGSVEADLCFFDDTDDAFAEAERECAKAGDGEARDRGGPLFRRSSRDRTGGPGRSARSPPDLADLGPSPASPAVHRRSTV